MLRSEHGEVQATGAKALTALGHYGIYFSHIKGDSAADRLQMEYGQQCLI
jgi:hypothetical protein